MIELKIDDKNDKDLHDLVLKLGTIKCKSLLLHTLQKIKLKCTVSTCNDISEIKGLCKYHYQEVYSGFIDIHGNILKEKYTKINDKPCRLCDKTSFCRGLCKYHYSQHYRGIIDINGNKLNKRKIQTIKRKIGCTIKGCKNKHHAKGLCSIHYKRNYRGRL